VGGLLSRSDPAAGEEDALDCRGRFSRLLPTRQANHLLFCRQPCTGNTTGNFISNDKSRRGMNELMADRFKSVCFCLAANPWIVSRITSFFPKCLRFSTCAITQLPRLCSKAALMLSGCAVAAHKIVFAQLPTCHTYIPFCAVTALSFSVNQKLR
jgi:hypothetical protein